ncbi:DUF1453 family protein [Solihabitans fulvus]|uniref:DUF1453 family protein n=1 Tax=Solihabitans fulvus TaxID=1892852 RepID=A0A5B2XQM6_9PSEU|nr:DUF1453 family protein [Solihabitans fulvus]KAA2265260.1 DUF1453 family protein [Solihabitans fulvus]
MNGWMLTGLIVVGVIVVIVKRLTGEPLNARDLLGPPVVLTAIGGYAVAKVDHLTATDIGWLALGSVVGLGFGALRGTTIRLFTKDGVLWQRYSGRTFLVWVISLAGNGGLDLLAKANGMHHEARPTTLAIGISLLGEAVVVGLRAHATKVPFAPERRVGSWRQ